MFSDSLDLSLQLPGDKILGLAKFFLGIGVPGDTKDFFNQIDSLARLENNRQVLFFFFLVVCFIHCWETIVLKLLTFSIMWVVFLLRHYMTCGIFTGVGGFFCWSRVSVPLIVSLPSTVLSLTKKDQLKVRLLSHHCTWGSLSILNFGCSVPRNF